MKKEESFCLFYMRHMGMLVMAFVVSAMLMGSTAYALGSARITSPRSDQVVGGNVLTVHWKRPRGAKSYKVCVREAGTSRCMVSKVTTESSTRFRISSTLNALKGKRVSLLVTACKALNGDGCVSWSHIDVWFMGPPVRVSSPVDGTSYTGTDRRPTFSWQPYTGISGSGSVTYTLIIAAHGAPRQVFSGITNTSYRPPTAIKSAFQNPVRWLVTAYKGGNRSASSRARTLTLAASSSAVVSAPNLRSPANGSTVDTGSLLRWDTVTNADSYKVCLGLSSNGCSPTHIVHAPTTSYSLTRKDLRRYRNKTMYWSVQTIVGRRASVAKAALRNVHVSAGS